MKKSISKDIKNIVVLLIGLLIFSGWMRGASAAFDAMALAQDIQNAATVEQVIELTLKAITASPDDLLEVVKAAVAAAPLDYADDIAAAVAKAHPNLAQEIANAAATMKIDAANLIAEAVAKAVGKDISEIKVLRPAVNLEIPVPEPALESIASPG